MKYTLTVNQKACFDLGIKNINQAHIFSLLMSASTWAKGYLMPDNEISYWVARQVVCDELPLLNMKPDTVYRHMKSLSELGVIDYQKDGKKDMIRVTKKGKKYLSSRYVGNKSELGNSTMSEINPSKQQNSEINPNLLGNKSEKNSEINPTYQDTSIISTTNKSSKEKQPAKSTETWNAYSRAYLQRYDVAPLRGAKVNSLLCQFVDVVGTEQAPLVAAYYIQLNDQWYQKKSHDIPTLVQNAQSIFTQWARGTNQTSQDYRQQERRSGTASKVESIRNRIESRTS